MATNPQPKMTARNVNVHYGEKHAIKDVNIDVRADEVTAFIGPSGCGKSTFLRCLNRMNDTVASARVTGEIALDGENIYDKSMDVVQLRGQQACIRLGARAEDPGWARLATKAGAVLLEPVGRKAHRHVERQASEAKGGERHADRRR